MDSYIKAFTQDKKADLSQYYKEKGGNVPARRFKQRERICLDYSCTAMSN